MEPKYWEQYKRMLRWYERFSKINQDRIHDMTPHSHHDDVFAFFMNCYHLKDWIKNDPESEVSEDVVENFVHTNLWLKICGDICNGGKHLNLHSPKVGNGAQWGKRHFTLGLGKGAPFINVRYEIMAEGKIYDAFSVAKECIEAWYDFLCVNAAHFRFNFPNRPANDI